MNVTVTGISTWIDSVLTRFQLLLLQEIALRLTANGNLYLDRREMEHSSPITLLLRSYKKLVIGCSGAMKGQSTALRKREMG